MYGYKNRIYKNWNKEFNTVLINPEYDRIIDKVYNYAKEIDSNI